MQEFVLAIFLAFLPDGTPVAAEMAPMARYSDCVTLNRAAEELAKATLPEGSVIRWSCIPTERIGQNDL